MPRHTIFIVASIVGVLSSCGGRNADAEETDTSPRYLVEDLVGNFCLDCHNSFDETAGIDFDSLEWSRFADDREVWEKVVRRLRSRQMPPSDAARPDEATYVAVLEALESSLDQLAKAKPQPGRTDTFRRLTRTEYQNAIRDLLALDVNAAALLPRDESSHGFDNVTVGELSPTLLNRYVSAAQKISQLAVGRASKAPGGDTFRVPPDLTQERHLAGLPLGTRGGAVIPYNFPVDGEYEITIRLARDRNEEVEGLNGEYELDVLLDRESVAAFTIHPLSPGNKDYSKVDAHLHTRLQVPAGPHELGVTFLRKSASLLETKRQPYQARFNMYRHPRTSPALYQVSITGPFEVAGPGDTPSRRRIFDCYSDKPENEEACARTILSNLARHAWRGPIDEGDLDRPLAFYRQARAEGGFVAGIEAALASILVSPRFLFRIERDPPDVPSGTAYRISDLDLASRLSFFIWSSIPDEELLGLAERGELSRSDVLEAQVRRMLADDRSSALATNFAGQWLYLRNLEGAHPDMRLFPDFDDNLRQAMRRETELFFESILREDRSVLDLLRADYTYLNERLARHYGIPQVIGSRFRRVHLDEGSRRGGLLRQGSILTVTSYATRTSPVIRGHWILENLLGTPPPPPPDNVPALKDNDNTVSAALPVRERLMQHRADPNCSACHNLMDPVGFSLENFDAIGRWRDLEASHPVDASGGLPDGTEFMGVDGLEDGLMRRPELFVGTLTEKLLTYALGRGVDYRDAPSIRRIVRDAQARDFRFLALVLGITQSVPFQMRTAE